MRRQDVALSAEEALTIVDQVQFAVLSLVDEPDEKRRVMTWVVERKSPDYMDRGQKVIEKMLDRLLVYKMSMEVVSGKHGL